MSSDWTRVWSAPGERLFVERRVEPDHVRHRFRSNGPGDGAVVVLAAEDRVLLIEIVRPVIGRTLLELPRGQAEADDDGPDAVAAREGVEETGFVIHRSEVLGRVWPDSGLSGDGVHVVHSTDFSPPPPGAPAPEFATRWLSPDEVTAAVVDGRIRDAITLAALTVVAASRVRAEAPPYPPTPG